MKGVSGVIGGVVVIILLLVAVSLTLAAMNYAYGVQQIEAKTIINQLSQPHVAQVGPDTVMSSGRIVASYIIYPDGRIAFLNLTVSGIKGFQSYLNGNPWAIVVFSNGQWINVTNADIGSTSFGILGTGSYMVPYYPGNIVPSNYTQLASIIYNGTRYNTPLYCHVNATFLSMYYNVTSGNFTLSNITVDVNPSNPLVFSDGRILEVPVTSEDGWLNFTAVSVNDGGICFAILVPNTTGVIVALYFNISPYYSEINSSSINSSLSTLYMVSSSSYGIYQFINYPASVPPLYIPVFYKSGYALPGTPYVLNPNISYSFTNGSVPYTPIVKVALKFSQGQPAQMYLWYGYYNGSGISWKRLFLPSFNVSTGTVIGLANSIIAIQTYGIWEHEYVVGYTADWCVTTEPSWPINIYSEYSGGWRIFAEPLNPQLGSDILVVPLTSYQYPPSNIYTTLSGTAIVNVAYSI